MASRPLTTRRRITTRIDVPRIELVVEREAGRPATRSVVIDGELCRIGTHPANELSLDDPHVSRFHVRLSRTESGWRLTDTGSANGTTINGVRVRDVDLPQGECRIELGDARVLVRELGGSAAEVPVWTTFGSIYGTTVAMQRLFGVLDRVAKSDATVLVEGESGTGKELVATEIVRAGARADRPLSIVDCGAIAPNLVESELFGHVRGAFTGADRDRVGAFESADGGTLFLDEIGEMPLELQPKLLRALEAREIRRLGDARSKRVDVRVIAATNRDLEREVNAGRFREDLYFRLSVVKIRVPPLRERIGDLGLLVRVFLEGLGESGAGGLFPQDLLERMAQYDWPGNVRELRNYVQRVVVLGGADPAATAAPVSVREDAPSDAPGAPAVDLDLRFTDAKDRVVADFERAYLTALLAWAEGNVSRAARKASMDRMYLYRLLQRHGIRSGSFKD